MKKCIKCGSPLSGSVCSNCGLYNNLDEIGGQYDDLEELKCKESNLTFFSVGFSFLFGIPFLLAGLIPFIFFIREKDTPLWVYLELAVFFLVGFCFCLYSIIKILRYLLVNRFGKEIYGQIIKIKYSNSYYNGIPGKILVIKIDTDEGPRIINYDLLGPVCSYNQNDMVVIKMYKNYFKLQ